jgi:hypothetical protein
MHVTPSLSLSLSLPLYLIFNFSFYFCFIYVNLIYWSVGNDDDRLAGAAGLSGSGGGGIEEEGLDRTFDVMYDNMKDEVRL